MRLLATSDLHGFVLDWDYYRARQDPTVGPAGVATLIDAARRGVNSADTGSYRASVNFPMRA